MQCTSRDYGSQGNAARARAGRREGRGGTLGWDEVACIAYAKAVCFRQQGHLFKSKREERIAEIIQQRCLSPGKTGPFWAQ